MITQSRLKKLFRYDHEAGVFVRIISTSSNAHAGDIAGCIGNRGYVQINISGRIYVAHRLVWLYVHGRWPVDEIDHKNGIRDDNRLKNLREATRAENQQNRSIISSNTSGYPGVDWNKRKMKWRARISINGQKKWLGYFDSPENAATAYQDAKHQIHKFQPTVRLPPHP